VVPLRQMPYSGSVPEETLSRKSAHLLPLSYCFREILSLTERIPLMVVSPAEMLPNVNESSSSFSMPILSSGPESVPVNVGSEESSLFVRLFVRVVRSESNWPSLMLVPV